MAFSVHNELFEGRRNSCYGYGKDSENLRFHSERVGTNLKRKDLLPCDSVTELRIVTRFRVSSIWVGQIDTSINGFVRLSIKERIDVIFSVVGQIVHTLVFALHPIWPARDEINGPHDVGEWDYTILTCPSPSN